MNEAAFKEDTYVAIQGIATEQHRIPSVILTQVVNGFQRVAWILGAADEGQTVEKRFRPSEELKNRHMLEWGVPENGSYVLPLYQSKTETYSTNNDLSVIFEILQCVAQEDINRFRNLVPDSRLRDKLLAALKNLLPNSWDNWQIKYTHQGKESKWLDSKSWSIIKTWFPKILANSEDETLTIKGDLISIDFEANKVVVRYLPTHREIECIYIAEIEDSILESRKGLIEVTGRFVLDENGHPTRLTEVSRINPVDLSLMAFTQFESGDRVLFANQPITFLPFLDEETSQLYIIKNDQIGISIIAYTKEEMMEMLVEQVFFLWDTYGANQISEADLTDDALRLRKQLHIKFRE